MLFLYLMKGDNFHDFLFAYVGNLFLPKYGQLLMVRICSKRSKFFPIRVDSHSEAKQNVNGRVASPEYVHIYLKSYMK